MVHSVPYVCVNLGTGSLMRRCNWVEYCNIEKGTYYSDLRIKNGHVLYKVKYWGLEMKWMVRGRWVIKAQMIMCAHLKPVNYEVG